MKLTAHQCDNFREFVLADNLAVIKKYSERVADGEPVPSGECPECGCLCHEVEVKIRHRFKVKESDGDFNSFHIFGETREVYGLDGMYETAINDSLDLVRELAKVGFPTLPANPTPAEQLKAMSAFALTFGDLINKARAIPGVVETKDS